MSTKTTIKRIALVAVSALGLGVLSSVAPASAARTVAAGTNDITGISVSADVAPVSGTLGVASLATVTWTSDTTTSGIAINPSIKLTSGPTVNGVAGITSAVAPTAVSSGSAVAAGNWNWFKDTGTPTNVGTTFKMTQGTSASNLAIPNTSSDTISLTSANAAGYMTGKSYLYAHYAVPGTYTWTIWDDQNLDGIVNGTEFSQTYTVVVSSGDTASAVATGTFTAIGGSDSTSTKVSTTSGNSGSLVKLTLKDAAGNPVAPGVGSTVTVSVNGSAVIAKLNDATAGSGTSQSYILSAGDFNSAGAAFLNITDTVAETVVLSASGSGWSTFTAPSGLGLTFSAVTAGTSVAFANITGSNLKTVTAGSAYSYNYLGATVTIGNSDTTTTNVDNVNVTDTAGYLTGLAGADWDIQVAGAATTGGTASFVLPAKTTSGVTALTLTVNGAGSTTIASAAASAYTVAVYGSTVATQKAAVAAAVPMTVRVKNEFGQVVSGILVTGSISGRNSAVTIASVSTDASGIATLTYTDASTSTTSTRDVATLTVSGATTSATVTTDFVSTANLGVKTIVVSTPSTNSYDATTPLVAGADKAIKTYSSINAGATGAQAGQIAVYAYVTDANSVALQGVPVTFSVAGTGAAIRSTYVTAYTDNTGVATSYLYAWTAGSYVVTAKYGTVSATANSYWRQDTPATYSRNISATANGSVVTATVKDRFGNPVVGAAVSASRSGTGYFAGGTTSVSGALTGADGTVDFVFVGNATVTVNLGTTTATTSYGDDAAIAGYVGSTKLTATTTGTVSTGEVGVGASYSAAGNHTATADVSAASGTDAVDAANEATDAANAATDAANAAAEAADAATAAAQDAQAAVAALASQVADLIAGIKAQITALTNLVIKIQKKVKA